MAISLVGSNFQLISPGVSPSTLANNPTAGNLLIVGYTVFSTTPTLLSDNKSNSWNQITSAQDGGSNFSVIYWSKLTTGGSSFQISYADTNGPSLVPAEFTGEASSPLDTSTSAIGQGTQPTKAIITGTANELVVCTMRSEGTGTIALNSGWSILEQQTDDGSHERIVFAYQIAASAGSVTATATSGYSGAWSMVLAAFKPATNTANFMPFFRP